MMAFNGAYHFKSKVAEYGFMVGMITLGLNGIATLFGFGKTSSIIVFLFSLLCLGFAYLMEKEMGKK